MRLSTILVSLFLVTFRIASAEAPFGPVGGGTPDEMAGQAYGAGGCGLGSMLWGSAPGMNQALAVTTNLILFNQSFGISFGTLGCLSEDETSGAITFSDQNQETLLAEIARGEGETVTTLGEILHCQPASALGGKLQTRFESIVPQASAAIGRRLLHTIRTDTELRALCPENRT